MFAPAAAPGRSSTGSPCARRARTPGAGRRWWGGSSVSGCSGNAAMTLGGAPRRAADGHPGRRADRAIRATTTALSAVIFTSLRTESSLIGTAERTDNHGVRPRSDRRRPRRPLRDLDLDWTRRVLRLLEALQTKPGLARTDTKMRPVDALMGPQGRARAPRRRTRPAAPPASQSNRRLRERLNDGQVDPEPDGNAESTTAMPRGCAPGADHAGPAPPRRPGYGQAPAAGVPHVADPRPRPPSPS